MSAAKLFPEEEQTKIERAIADAESLCSGEIRVHIESHCPEDVLDRAAFIFDELEMQNTEQRNGVLIYLATEDHKYGVIGDGGIHQKVGNELWKSTKQTMHYFFAQGQLTEGLCAAVLEVGKSLQEYFPVAKGNQNELDNTISFGE